MDETQRQRKLCSAFIICEARSDIHPLVEILLDSGLHTLNTDDAIEPVSSSIPNSTQELINRADFVCAILNDANSPNIYYELGYANGRNLPLVVICDAATLPIDLPDAFWIKATLRDRDALAFQFRAFIENVDAFEPTKSGYQRPIPRRSSSRKLIHPAQLSLSYEREFLEVLKRATEVGSVMPGPGEVDPSTYVPDFAIWLAGSFRDIANPIVIELKAHRLRKVEIRDLTNRLKVYSRGGNIRTALIIIRSDEYKTPWLTSLSPLIFVLDFDAAKDLLSKGGLVEALRRERNRVFHSAG